MLQPWRTESSQYLVTDTWLRLRADRCVRPDGHVIAPYYVLEFRDFVHALPVRADGRIGLVRQYRHGAGGISLELPGGLLDDGETPLAGARRELAEECGFAGGTWLPLARFRPDAARQNNWYHCFLARDVTATGTLQPDANEEIEVRWLTVSEVDAAIAAGEFCMATHLAAYLMARPLLGG